jgi:hypothetical protein
MMRIAEILSLAARVEAERRRNRSIPANENDPKGPPPAAAARIRAIKIRGQTCNTTISRF